MSEQTPIRDELRAPFEEADLSRVWSRVSRARLKPTTPKVPWAIAAAAVIAALALALQDRAPEKLTLASGDEIDLRVGANRLSDGSEIALDEGAVLVPLIANASETSFLLEQGRITVSITPNPERKFTFECGLATVEVIGTRFTIDRQPERVTIEVHEGIVLIRSALLEQQALRATRGDRLVLAAKASKASEAPVPVPVPTLDPVPVPVTVPPVRKSVPAPTPSPVPDRIQDPLSALLSEADELRRANRHEEASALFRAILTDHPNDARAALAAFSLGKLELEQNARPREAAQAFQQALTLGLPAVLVEDAYLRLYDAQLLANDPAAAQTAKLYVARFPNGRHRDRLSQ